MLFNLILRSLAFQRCIIVHIKCLKIFENFEFFLKKYPKLAKFSFPSNKKKNFNKCFFIEFFVWRISIIYHWIAEDKTFQRISLFSFQHYVTAEQFRLEAQTISFPKKTENLIFFVFLIFLIFYFFKIRWGSQIRIQLFPVNLKLVWSETVS